MRLFIRERSEPDGLVELILTGRSHRQDSETFHPGAQRTGKILCMMDTNRSARKDVRTICSLLNPAAEPEEEAGRLFILKGDRTEESRIEGLSYKYS